MEYEKSRVRIMDAEYLFLLFLFVSVGLAVFNIVEIVNGRRIVLNTIYLSIMTGFSVLFLVWFVNSIDHYEVEYEVRCENCSYFTRTEVMDPVDKKHMIKDRCKKHIDRYGFETPATDTGYTRGIWSYLENSKPCKYFRVDKDKVG